MEEVNLTDLFEVVLKSAIEAQFKANEYSAELAEKLKMKQQATLMNESGKVNANPFYPVPNSNFERIGVNLKVNINEIETDLERTQIKIIRDIQAKLGAKLPHLEQINTFAKPLRLSRELLKCENTVPVNIYDRTIEYFTSYIYNFWIKLKEHHKDAIVNFNELAAIENLVFENIGDCMKPTEIKNDEYLEIRNTIKALASNSSSLKNIKLSIADEAKNDNLTASIEMSVNMRTFSWENYGKE